MVQINARRVVAQNNNAIATAYTVFAAAEDADDLTRSKFNKVHIMYLYHT